MDDANWQLRWIILLIMTHHLQVVCLFFRMNKSSLDCVDEQNIWWNWLKPAWLWVGVRFGRIPTRSCRLINPLNVHFTFLFSKVRYNKCKKNQTALMFLFLNVDIMSKACNRAITACVGGCFWRRLAYTTSDASLQDELHKLFCFVLHRQKKHKLQRHSEAP